MRRARSSLPGHAGLQQFGICSAGHGGGETLGDEIWRLSAPANFHAAGMTGTIAWSSRGSLDDNRADIDTPGSAFLGTVGIYMSLLCSVPCCSGLAGAPLESIVSWSRPIHALDDQHHPTIKPGHGRLDAKTPWVVLAASDDGFQRRALQAPSSKAQNTGVTLYAHRAQKCRSRVSDISRLSSREPLLLQAIVPVIPAA